jgi:butyryl-CoA dehydrogenase
MKAATTEPRTFEYTGPLVHERRLLQKAKHTALTSLSRAAQMNKLALSEQQVIMLGIADIIIDTYAMESAILRTEKLSDASSHLDTTQVFCSDAIQRIEATSNTPNTVAARQRIAKLLVEAKRQP